MSQVKFHTVHESVDTPTDKRIQIVAGWDRPLGSYHMTVFDLDAAEDAETDVIWCQMDHVGFPKTTEKLRQQLDGMGIDSPAGFWGLVEKQEGSVVHTYDGFKWSRREV